MLAKYYLPYITGEQQGNSESKAIQPESPQSTS